MKRRIHNRDLNKIVEARRSTIHGKGLFALKRFRPGQYLGTYHGPMVEDNGTYVLWVEEEPGCWLKCDGKNSLRYLNHSATPNAEFDGLDLYALKNIQPEQEITFDYGEDPAAI